MGHADKSGQCALVHAGLKGHAEIVDVLLGQDWGAEGPADAQQQSSGESATGKTQAAQRAVTAAASVGHAQVRLRSRSERPKNASDNPLKLCVEQHGACPCLM